MNGKTLEQTRADIRKSIARDSKIGLWTAFWQQIIYQSNL